MSWLDRDDAPFGQEVWNAIDAAARDAAAEVLSGRSLLPVLGPTGIALRAGVGDDDVVEGPGGEEEGGPHLHLPRVRALPLLHHPFRLGVRTVEAFLARGEPLDLGAVSEAARKVAELEERLVYHGHAGARLTGLVPHPGAVRLGIGDWSDPSRAADDLLGALAALDAAGHHGPFAAALAPRRYWQLFRPHPGTSLTPHAQLRDALLGGVFKSPALQEGAVVVARSAAGPRIILGQDLTAAYDGREGVFHEFSLAESVTLLEGAAGSVAVLAPA